MISLIAWVAFVIVIAGMVNDYDDMRQVREEERQQREMWEWIAQFGQPTEFGHLAAQDFLNYPSNDQDPER